MKILIAKAYAKIMFDGLLARELKNRGHEVHLLLPERSPECLGFEQEGISVWTNPVIQMRYLRQTRLWQDLFHFRGFVRLLRREKYDIVNLHLPAARLFGRLAARLVPPTRIVSVLHGLEVHHERFSNPLDHATVCVSRAVQQNMAHHHIRRKKWHVVPNGIDLARMDAVPKDRFFLHRELGLDQSIRLIGMLAYFYEVRDSVNKGHEFFIDAAARLQDRYPDLRFVIVGSDRLTRGREDFFKAYAQDCGVADRIFFLGERHDIVPILDSLTLHVFPSLKEGFGMALIEAMSRGVVNVASDIPGIREIITDQKDGFLFAPANAETMFHQITRLLDNPDLVAALARQGRRRVEELFTMTRMGERYEKIFTDLLPANPTA